MKNGSFKFNLSFIDRIGIVADASRCLAGLAVTIVSMEVQRKGNLSDVYLEVTPEDKRMSGKTILEALSGIETLQSVRFIETMPAESRQNTFHTVLDNVSDGILSIDTHGKITTINQLARSILGCRTKNVIGRRLETITTAETGLSSCLGGNSYSRMRQSVSTDHGRIEFFTSARPIMDAGGRIIGAVEIMKDMKAIKALVEEVALSEGASFDAFVGATTAVKQAISFARKIAATNSIVSIRGASGTGKELFARAIHAESRRRGAFIAVNCAAIPDSLLESELFGYAPGAFTGAQTGGRAGLFEQANHGTLFLDEIGELPSGPQAKILRAIQDNRIRRIGGQSETELDVRIITATNQNLEQLVQEGAFRQDLYYRINVLPVHLPPLSARVSDISLLAGHFLFQVNCKLGNRLQRLSDGAVNKLEQHDWPGNVRELKNVIERAAILCETADIGPESIVFGFELSPPARPGQISSPSGEATGGKLTDRLDALERKIIVETLKASKSIRQAASRLGISHTTLRNKIKKHRLR